MTQPSRPVSRRRLLTGGAAALGGALVGGGVLAATDRQSGSAAAADPAAPTVEPFHGARQAGVATEPQSHAAFVAFTLHRDTDRAALGRMLRLLTDDAARLTCGEPALADTEPELAATPARLTVTVGFGPGLYRAAGLPSPVADLPVFRIDRLQPAWTGGDLLLQVCSDDPVTVAHAQRMLVKDARPFGAVRWVQQGFRRPAGAESHTQRNLLGQVDGTANPKPGEAGFETVVWDRDATTLVLRRIRAEMEKWDELGRTDKELAVGRRLGSGAPLTGTAERDEPDLEAVDAVGLPVIPEFSHVARARVDTSDPRKRILRRPYNYDGVPDAAGHPDSGLIFASYQANIEQQFLPIQRRLSVQDLLNEWTHPHRLGRLRRTPRLRPRRLARPTHPGELMRALLTLATTAAGIVLLAPAAPAFAHNTLASSTPAEDSTLTTAPAQARLTFTDRLSSLVTVVVTDTDRKKVDAARPAVTGATATVRFTRPLANGTYTVAYRVVSNDGHTIQGAYGFRVTAPTPAATAAAPTQAAPTTTVAPSTSPAAAATVTVSPAGPAEADGDGSGTGGIVALIALPVAAVAAGGVILARRRRTG